jgi:hypothetical protein
MSLQLFIKLADLSLRQAASFASFNCKGICASQYTCITLSTTYSLINPIFGNVENVSTRVIQSEPWMSYIRVPQNSAKPVNQPTVQPAAILVRRSAFVVANNGFGCKTSVGDILLFACLMCQLLLLLLVDE